MNNVWRWLIGIAVGMLIFTLLVYGRSTRDAYHYARGAITRPVQPTQEVIRVPAHIVNPASGNQGPIIIYYWRR
jgi:hypothetical protein